MSPEAENKVITERAPCGLICTRCDTFNANICLGCYVENSKMKKKCVVMDGEAFEESKKVVECMGGKKIAQCYDCEEFSRCQIYDDLLLICPLKRPVYDLKVGFGFLITEKKPVLGYKIFSDMVRHGANGMCITRQHPKNLKKNWGKGDVKVYWLTSFEGEGNLQPTNLGLISEYIIRFIERNENTVVFVDGIELLITQNDYPTMLRMVNHIIEVVMQKDTRFIITLDERTLEKKELALLERNMETVG